MNWIAKETRMAKLTRYNPFGELLTRQSPVSDLLEEWSKGLFLSPFRFEAEEPGRITLDVTENDKAYTVRAEIPGVKKEDIKISVDGNQVSISAEVKKEKEDLNP
jgi:HSP20 family protein